MPNFGFALSLNVCCHPANINLSGQGPVALLEVVWQDFSLDIGWGGRGHSHVFLKRAEGRVTKSTLKYTKMLLALARENSPWAQQTHGYAIYSQKGKWPCQDDLH